jgi:peptide/nickel transport system ATP-binding protein
MESPLLKINDLSVHFFLRKGILKAVDAVDLEIGARETLGIVGESGSGKSVTAMAIMRLIASPGKIVNGEIRLNSENLLSLTPRKMRAIRGNEISMIFQEPMTSLNPVFNVGRQLSETLMVHQRLRKKRALEKSAALLEQVGIPDPGKRLNDFPHQLSGGMRQRVMIAMALACEPSLLIADEPTTALDVTIQAQILDLIAQLKATHGTSIIMISHDLGVIAEIAQRVAIMYAGRIVEIADVMDTFENPHHPYTKGLLKAIPYLHKKRSNEKLYEIRGIVPSLIDLPPGCKFVQRCRYAMDKCHTREPSLRNVGDHHYARCWL